ncbi:transporter substrate-binding domain-containing protein [Nocardioides alkalitolerans]|uniref:transporter substrate-binding domain-containing protein n=1 Tax=Nocardioides alkalitolerans TaxID=281714 RepID=UPI001FDFC94F|nr:transporter substrate-binding domain-containing protein [Nocardioides alkalitolerans]
MTAPIAPPERGPDRSAALREALCPGGTLRAVINLGNPVLVQGTPEAPTGVTVDIVIELARRLGVPLELRPVGAARDSYAALVDGQVDLGFLAVEPAREEGVRFTRPYVGIEGVYAVRPGSPLAGPADVDVAGTTIAVRRGSAYDLYLTRTVRNATVVRGDEVVDVFVDQRLDVLSGVRQPTEELAAAHGLRVLEPAFQAIRQAVAVPRARGARTVELLDGFVAELKDSGFVAASLRRAGQVASVPD